jgi:prepilin-type processing-associated H-X9-DG protein
MRGSSAAFTLVEVLVLTTVVLLIFGLAVPTVSVHHRRSNEVRCVHNLKDIGLACRIFAVDHAESLSLRTNSADVRANPPLPFENIFNELSSPRILVCPADEERSAAKSLTEITTGNISYFATLSARGTNSAAFLGGDRNLRIDENPVPSGLFILQTNGPTLSWSSKLHGGRGNILFADGSVQQLGWIRLSQAARRQGIATNVLTIP